MGDDVSSDRLAELGRSLAGRADEVGATVLARAERLLQRYDPDIAARLAPDIARRCSMGTSIVAAVLVTGRPPTRGEWEPISTAGKGPAADTISLADMTKLYLSWRDAAMAAAAQEATALATDPETLAAAQEMIRQGCDASLVRTAREFDTTRRELQAQLAAEQARLAHLARHDALTGLPNRLVLFDRLAELIESCRDGKSGAAVLFIDLDRFKSVNDASGHNAGDELLVGVARRLGGVLRPTDLLARLGGDEFVVACGDLHDPVTGGRAVVKRLRAALEMPFRVDGRPYDVSASIGLTTIRPDDDPQRVLSQADAAMYAEKQRRVQPAARTCPPASAHDGLQ